MISKSVKAKRRSLAAYHKLLLEVRVTPLDMKQSLWLFELPQYEKRFVLHSKLVETGHHDRIYARGKAECKTAMVTMIRRCAEYHNWVS